MTKHDDRYNHSEKGRERWRRYARKKYCERQAEGICTRCGKDVAISDAYCGDCLTYKEEHGLFSRLYSI